MEPKLTLNSAKEYLELLILHPHSNYLWPCYHKYTHRTEHQTFKSQDPQSHSQSRTEMTLPARHTASM